MLSGLIFAFIQDQDKSLLFQMGIIKRNIFFLYDLFTLICFA